MMKLSTMKKVHETIDNEWRSPIAEEILERWGYDSGTVYFYRASANFIFIFKKNGKIYYLRFSDSNEKELKAIQSELTLIKSLSNNSDLDVVQPLISLSGNYIEVVDTEIGMFYAVVFEGLTGEELDIECISNEQAHKWGATLGSLHEEVKMLPDDEMAITCGWKHYLSKEKEYISQTDEAALEEFEFLLNWTNTLPVTKQNFGRIHYDFELDNLKWDNGRFSILDFDDSTHLWYVADIAYALRDLFDQGFDPNNRIFIEFVKGYRTTTGVDETLLTDMPNFLRLHQLLTYIRLIRSMDIVPSSNQPEWLNSLISKLQQKIKIYQDSFLCFKGD